MIATVDYFTIEQVAHRSLSKRHTCYHDRASRSGFSELAINRSCQSKLQGFGKP